MQVKILSIHFFVATDITTMIFSGSGIVDSRVVAAEQVFNVRIGLEFAITWVVILRGPAAGG